MTVLSLLPSFLLDKLEIDPRIHFSSAVRAVSRSRTLQSLRRHGADLDFINKAWLSVPRAALRRSSNRAASQAELSIPKSSSVNDLGLGEASGQGPAVVSEKSYLSYEPSDNPMSEVSRSRGQTYNAAAASSSASSSRRGFGFSQNDKSAKHVLGDVGSTKALKV
eukprot:440111-Pleurochrysis_carterae.AAC.1